MDVYSQAYQYSNGDIVFTYNDVTWFKVTLTNETPVKTTPPRMRKVIFKIK